MNDDLQTLIRSADPEPDVRPYDDAARTRLLQRVVHLEAAPPGRPVSRPLGRRLAIGAAIAAVGALAITVTTSVVSSPAASAGIELTRDGNMYVVTITEPERDSAELTTALRAKGLDIELSTAPVSPSLVGSITSVGFTEGTTSIGELNPPPCLATSGCEIGFRVPVDFTGEAWVGLGRAAEPGEAYTGVNSSFQPGERFACADFIGRPVAEVTAEIEAAGVTVSYRVSAGGDSQDPSDYADLFVDDVLPASETSVVVFANPVSLQDVPPPAGC